MADDKLFKQAVDESRGLARLTVLQNYQWVFIFALLLVVAGEAFAIVALAVSRRVVPIPIMVNQLTGETQVIDTDISHLKWDSLTLLDNYFINQYVIARERFTPEMIETDYEVWNRFTCDATVAAQANKNVDLDTPGNYFERYRDKKVIPTIKSINFLRLASDTTTGQKASDLRYYTVLFQRDLVAAGNKSSRIDYQLSIGVTFEQRAETAQHMRLNPFGFCVHSYNLTSLTNPGNPP